MTYHFSLVRMSREDSIFPLYIQEMTFHLSLLGMAVVDTL